MALVVLIGASGSGKTTIAHAVAARADIAARVFHFDSIGVPSLEQMLERHGSKAAWQRAKTIDWMMKLARVKAAGTPVLFEGQTRFSFLADGAAAAGGLAYVPILLDCDDATRSRRLRLERNQPELASAEMFNWAQYLRRQARQGGHQVLDTSALSLADSTDYVVASLGR